MNQNYDILSMGRSLIDLYANEVGATFPQIKNFAAYVGGSPTNVIVGCQRLGLKSALLTAVGDDLVGDFIFDFLNREGVLTKYSVRKQGRRTSAVMLAMESQDKFPHLAYRDNCADTELSIDDVDAAPLDDTRALLITGTGLTREPGRSATIYAAERARKFGAKVFLDLDFRAEYWHDARAFGVAVRSVLRLVDVVIGTCEEVSRAIFNHHDQIDGNTLIKGIAGILHDGPEAVVMKRGAESTLTYVRGGDVIEAAPFKVEVYNFLGAGDAFASGLIYGYLKNWDWYRATRTGNACGAIVVTRHGCANFMPSEDEVLNFIREHGGF